VTAAARALRPKARTTSVSPKISSYQRNEKPSNGKLMRGSACSEKTTTTSSGTNR
jgi:hypothetical protein